MTQCRGCMPSETVSIASKPQVELATRPETGPRGLAAGLVNTAGGLCATTLFIGLSRIRPTISRTCSDKSILYCKFAWSVVDDL
jgi:hypothetical protein